MIISGFTMARHAVKLYYPIAESISSILPIVDEFVVALGDADMETENEILKLQSPKIKIIHTRWDLEKFPDGTENAHQTDLAKQACTGDWLFYLQADEVVHEKDLPHIQEACSSFLPDEEVEGLLFPYYHFWGDYFHYHRSHGWYINEIRLIRNRPDIHSWQSAQSFRRIPNFDGFHYRQKENTFKLKVVKVPAAIYHYGWVRPPHYMQQKSKALHTIHRGAEKANEVFSSQPGQFHYGNVNKLPVFRGTHPAVMQKRISEFNWQDQLDYDRLHGIKSNHKHEKYRYRFISFLENKLFGGRQIGAYKNYILLNR